MQSGDSDSLTGPTTLRRGGAGVLVLVVGPSGAGKDSLIDAARSEFADNPCFVFPTRVITRPDSPGERHDAMPPEQFAIEEAAGRFLLAWRSHGLAYAIPATVSAALTSGRNVVVNVSRTVIATAEAKVENVAVLHVTASAAARATRIRARGREDAGALAARLEREVPIVTHRSPVIEIANDGVLADAVARFMKVLQSIAAGCASQTGR